MGSREQREYDWQNERAMEAQQALLRRLGPEYEPEYRDEPVDEYQQELDEEDARLEALVESMSVVILCDGPEMDEPVFIEVM